MPVIHRPYLFRFSVGNPVSYASEVLRFLGAIILLSPSLFVPPCEGQTDGQRAVIDYQNESPRIAVERMLREMKSAGSLIPFVDNADCYPGSPQWEQVRWDQVSQRGLPGALPGTGKRTAEGCRTFFRELVQSPSKLARLVDLDGLASEVARSRGDRVDSVMAKFDSTDHYALLEKEIQAFAELMKEGELSVISEEKESETATVRLKFRLGQKSGETTFFLRRVDGRWYLNNSR